MRILVSINIRNILSRFTFPLLLNMKLDLKVKTNHNNRKKSANKDMEIGLYITSYLVIFYCS